MRALLIVSSVVLLSGCQFPLTAEIDQSCAASVDPTGCAKAKYDAAFAEERDRMFWSGGGL